MNCKKCGSKNMQVVSEYVESTQSYFSISLFIAAMIFLIFLIAGINSCSNSSMPYPEGRKSDVEYAELAYFFTNSIVGSRMLLIGLIGLLVVGIFSSLRPHKHYTRLVAVCLDCGERKVIWEDLSEEDSLYEHPEKNENRIYGLPEKKVKEKKNKKK